MKRSLAPLLILLLIPRAARAANLKLFGAVDAYGAGGISDTFEKDTRDVVNTITSLGITASGTTETKLGYGVRAGLIAPQNNDFEVGGSVGVVIGPQVIQTVKNGGFVYIPTSTTYGAGETKVTTDTLFYRMTIDAGKKFRIGEKAFLNVGAGVGAASGKVNQYVRPSGSAGVIVPSQDLSETWSGLTWEVSPSLLFPFGTAELELGLRYAQFPTKKETDNIGKIEFKPVSLFMGVRFGG